MILSSGRALQVQIPPPLDSAASPGLTLKEAQRRHILEVLKMTGWRLRGDHGAAQILGCPESTLRSRMKKLGIKRSGGASEQGFEAVGCRL